MGGEITSACLMMVALFLTMSSSSEAQSGESASCAQDLIPCADYLKSTNPPSSCCDPLKKTVETQLTCLCDLFYSPGLLQTFNVSIDQALQLSRRCGVTSDLTSCNHNGSAPPPSTGGPPVAHEGGDKGASSRVSFTTGFSILLLLLGVGASMLFN